MNALSISHNSFTTFTSGAAEFVVQDAFESSLLEKSNPSSFTPNTTVGTPPDFAGALMITLLAPPTKCFEANSSVLNTPVDSITVSTPISPQGIFSGSR